MGGPLAELMYGGIILIAEEYVGDTMKPSD